MRRGSDRIHPGLFRQPDISETHIVFVYAGDIWLVAKAGGTARRLTREVGEEVFPRFNPDGDRIAYSAGAYGSRDLYVLSTEGPTNGVDPKRVTFHPGNDRMVGWHPSGESLVFSSNRETHNGLHQQLFQIPAGGGGVERLPFPDAEFGAYSSGDSPRFFAFQFLGRDFEYWKRYRGGRAPELFVQDLETGAVHRLTASQANDAFPMWHGGDLYFVSDREDGGGKAGRRFEIFVFRDLERKLKRGKIPDPVRLTGGDQDVRFPAIGPSDLVFARGGQIFRVRLDVECPDFDHPERVEIEGFAEGLARLRARHLEDEHRVDDRIESFELSPEGRRLVVAARGELFMLPTDGGKAIRLGYGSGSAERNPTWVDRYQIVCHSDLSGEEYHLIFRDLRQRTRKNKKRAPAKIAGLKEGFRYRIEVSPKGDRVAFLDHAGRLWIVDRESRHAVLAVEAVAGMSFLELEEQRLTWSPDGRTLVFYAVEPNGHRALWAYRSATGARRLTSGYFDDWRPAFDPDGEYLYFVTLRGLRSFRNQLDGFSRAYVDSERLARIRVPKSGCGPGELRDADVEILPLPAACLEAIRPIGGERLVVKYRSKVRDTSSLALVNACSPDLKILVEDPEGFSVSGDGSILVVKKDDELLRLDLEEASSGIVEPEPLDTSTLCKPLDRRQEWRQIFRESWRLIQDFYHDEHRLREIDWDAQLGRYETLLGHVTTREDLNHLINELLGEVGSSHTIAWGGDQEEATQVEVGLLGADLALDEKTGCYSVARILRAGPWEAQFRSPLLAAGIPEKSCIVAVDDVPLDAGMEPWAAFEQKAGSRVTLKVHPGCFEGSGEQLVEVRTLTWKDERLLRLLHWVEENRRFVERETERQVGYVYIPNTWHKKASLRYGYHLFVRQLFAQSDRPGLIFDTRYNPGGPFPHRIAEQIGRMASRRVLSRYGDLGVSPRPARTGAQVMLINAWTFSAGEMLAELFRRAGLGCLIGSRTGGGIHYWHPGPTLIDGGYTLMANVFSVDPITSRDFGIEGRGVEPCIEVGPDLTAAVRGHSGPQADRQLKAAIFEVIRILRRGDRCVCDVQ